MAGAARAALSHVTLIVLMIGAASPVNGLAADDENVLFRVASVKNDQLGLFPHFGHNFLLPASITG
jgi:hypothetical protein